MPHPRVRWIVVIAWAAWAASLACACSSSPPAPATSRLASAIVGTAGARDEPPAARELAAWLAAFNAGDRAKLVAYHQRRFPYEVASRNLGGIEPELFYRDVTGGFDLVKTEVSTATRFVAILKKRSGEAFHRVELELEAAEPHRVRRFQLDRIPPPDELLAPRMSEADALTALRAKLAQAVASDQFSGAVLVAKDGVPIFAQAYGFADRERKIPNTLDTRFRIASMGKMFTAVAALQLVQAGKLALSDSLGKVVPGYPNQTVASKVAIHHLLAHTGGTGDIFGPEFWAHRDEMHTLEDYVRLYGARDLKFEPGSTWEYSNYGFVLLGIVIERVTGQSYHDWVDTHVFKPAGMVSTASPAGARREPGRSISYTRRGPGAPWTSNEEMHSARGTSAGGQDSTVTDLLRFATALTNHQLLDAHHTELLTRAKAETPANRTYAYGFEDETVLGVRCFGHGGGAPGVNGKLAICESGYTIIVLANLDPPAADSLADFISLRLPAR